MNSQHQHITAKNYAAQAQRGLMSMSNQLRQQQGFKPDSLMIELFAKSIGEAQHFALPDDGVLFDDKLRGLGGLELRLPYPFITVEYFIHDKGARNPLLPSYAKKAVVLAMEIDRAIAESINNAKINPALGEGFIMVYAANEVADQWIPMPTGWIIPRIWDQPCANRFSEPYAPTRDDVGITGIPAPLCPGVINQLIAETGEEAAWRMMAHDIGGEIRAVLELCEALSCTNVSSEPLIKIDQAKAARRAKDGKLPLYETRYLIIDANNKPMPNGSKTQQQSGRNGPRQHLRRGHVRILGDRRTWVNSCVVGNLEKGRVDKNYGVI